MPNLIFASNFIMKAIYKFWREKNYLKLTKNLLKIYTPAYLMNSSQENQETYGQKISFHDDLIIFLKRKIGWNQSSFEKMCCLDKETWTVIENSQT